MRILSKKILQGTFLLTFGLIAIAICLYLGVVSEESYDNEAQFSTDIAALGIIGKSSDEAVSLLEEEGFSCDGLDCSRFRNKGTLAYWLELSGEDKAVEVGNLFMLESLLSCLQKQDVNLKVNEQGRVDNFAFALHRVYALHKPQWCDKYHEKIDGRRSPTLYKLSDDDHALLRSAITDLVGAFPTTTPPNPSIDFWNRTMSINSFKQAISA